MRFDLRVVGLLLADARDVEIDGNRRGDQQQATEHERRTFSAGRRRGGFDVDGFDGRCGHGRTASCRRRTTRKPRVRAPICRSSIQRCQPNRRSTVRHHVHPGGQRGLLRDAVGLRPLRHEGPARQESAPLPRVRRAAEPRQALLPVARAAEGGRGPQLRRRRSPLPARATRRWARRRRTARSAARRWTAAQRGRERRDGAGTRKQRRRIWPYVVAAIALVVLAIWFFFIRTPTARAHGHRASLGALDRDRGVRRSRGIGVAQRAAGRREHPGRARASSARRRRSPTARTCHTEQRRQEGRHVRAGEEVQAEVSQRAGRRRLVHVHACARWKQGRRGEGLGRRHDRAWPRRPAADAPATLGARRAGARTEKLYLDFGRQERATVADAAWRKYTDGQKVEGSTCAPLRQGRVRRSVVLLG